jgi:hypothetical protein
MRLFLSPAGKNFCRNDKNVVASWKLLAWRTMSVRLRKGKYGRGDSLAQTRLCFRTYPFTQCFRALASFSVKWGYCLFHGRVVVRMDLA